MEQGTLPQPMNQQPFALQFLHVLVEAMKTQMLSSILALEMPWSFFQERVWEE